MPPTAEDRRRPASAAEGRRRPASAAEGRRRPASAAEGRRRPASTIYHNPKCSTSRNALNLLRDNGYEPTVVLYLKTPPTRAELVELIAAAGVDVRTAVRKRESLYAELGLADASDDQLLDALAEHPILIERPFVVTDKGARLARPMDAVREIL